MEIVEISSTAFVSDFDNQTKEKLAIFGESKRNLLILLGDILLSVEYVIPYYSNQLYQLLQISVLET